MRSRLVCGGAAALQALLLLMLLPFHGLGAAPADDEVPPLSVRITSPLGRTGEPGSVRIVAQIRSQPDASLAPVLFYVDGKLLSYVSDGPPYATVWVDENPFEANEITVAVADDRGHEARDTVLLKPFEIIESTEVSGVLLETSVQDKNGRFIRALTRDDFTVLEDGVAQQFEVALEDLPTTFALLIDSSQSMSRRIDFVREAAHRLADFMRPRDRMLVVPFSKTLQPMTGPTDDRATVSEAIDSITARGGTAILDALTQLAPHLERLEGRRAVVVITDGYDEHSEAGFDQALKAIKEAQATVYVVGIGGVAGISLKGERFLRKLAAETGGRAFLPNREQELPLVHTAVASDAQNRYLLTYTPSNQEKDGKWRAISVATSNAGHIVRTRSGYFAPKPPPVRPSLEFTITDSKSRFIEVAADDLVVTENGVEQTIETFHEAVSPISIMLALDASGSMKKAAEAAKSAANAFVAALRPEDRLALVLFADRAELTHDLGVDREQTVAAIAEYTANGGTALYDALGDSLERLKRAEGRRAIVLVTDGRDENNPGTAPGSIRTFDDVLQTVGEVDAAIFAIGLGQNVDRRRLEKLAHASGGEAYFPEDVSQLETEYRRVVETLRRRWVISYVSSDSTRDGAWRPVDIRTVNPDAVVRSRGGYFAPER